MRKSYLSFPEATQRMGKTTIPNPDARKRSKWLRYVLLAVAGLGVYHILSGPSGAVNVIRLRNENAKLAGELDSLALRKQALEIEKQRLEKDSAFIEGVARRELGMAKPNEKVYRFVPPDVKKK
ncbi:MAG: septum formation initiator family protein [Fibrobacteria bacterium]